MVTITISGTPGSGKSTVGKLLEKKLGTRYVYSGKIFRETAKNYDMSLEEFGKYCEKNKKVDQELDRRQLEILQKGDVILEGRLAGWIAHRNKISALKIMLDADLETRAKRIVKREEGDVKKRKKEILNREKSEANRYKNYYNIDLKDTSIYDLVIDSIDKAPEEIVGIILEKIDR
ncbi:MAG: AAA family ATPase [Candidatus Thermoplasmatota archaeon]|nr:AAA family ATPase [Candidatus Thermoplasmatota archaeon]